MSLPPVPDATGRPLDQIRLLGLSAHGRHGVFDHERRDGQTFAVDVVVHLDTRPAAAGDALGDTVDYGRLAVAVADIVRGDPVDLIETLAARVAAACLEDARVAAADVTVHKPSAPVPESFTDIAVTIRRYQGDRVPAAAAAAATAAGRLDRRPERPVPAVLALGANLGDRAATLHAAVDELAGVPGVRVRAVSGLVETEPVGGPEQPDYLNAVVLVETGLSALELLDACQQLEAIHLRTRQVRWGARTLDVDVISYAGLRAATERLVLPHPRAAERAFVLRPWLDVDPGASLPGPDGPLPVAALLAAAADRNGVRAWGRPAGADAEPAR